MKKPTHKNKKKRPTLRNKLSKGFYKYLPLAGLLIFLIYRSDLAAQFFGSILHASNKPKTYSFRQYKCEQSTPESEHDVTPHEPYAFSSDLYKAKIAHPFNAVNFVRNNNLNLFNSNTNSPAGFIGNTDAGNVNYSTLHDNDLTFLRAEQTTQGSQAISGTWLHDIVRLKDHETYGFSVDYRSTIDSDISIELTLSDGSLRYEQTGLLKASSKWKTYSGYFDNSLYKAKGARIIVAPVNKGSLDTRAYNVYELPTAQLKQGIVSVTFDDGWQSTYKVGRLLFKKYNIKTTQYIVPEYSVNQVSGYMTMEEVTNLAKEGHEIGSHSLRHCNQAMLNLKDVTYDAQMSKRVLTDAGLSVKSYAYPYGGYTTQTTDIISQDYKFLRSSDDGFNDRYFDPLNIRTKAIYENTSNKEVQSWLNEARANKQWLVLIYHRLDETGDYTVSSKQLEQQLRMIHESGLRVMTVARAAAFVR